MWWIGPPADSGKKSEVFIVSFLVQQPNGLYCRFSTILDCPTDWNMTREDYINLCIEKAKEEANEVLDKHLRPFDEMSEAFVSNNMTEKEFNRLVKLMAEPISYVSGGDV